MAAAEVIRLRIEIETRFGRGGIDLCRKPGIDPKMISPFNAGSRSTKFKNSAGECTPAV
jgi:hypothetical protein